MVGVATPLQQQQQQQPLGTNFIPTSKPVQPVPPMQMMNAQLQQQQQAPMFQGVGMNNNGIGVASPVGVRTTMAGSTWSDVKGTLLLDSISFALNFVYLRLLLFV